MKSIQIQSELLVKIREQAESEYPSECCGLILSSEADPDTLTRLIACKNVQNEYHQKDPERFPRTSRNGFFLDPRRLLEIQKENRAKKETVRVIYHSHIDAEAYFSEEDKRMAAPDGNPAWPDVLYLVISVISGKAGEQALFSWDSGRKDFIKLS